MTPPPDHRPDLALGLANLFSVMERLKEDVRQERKAKEDAKFGSSAVVLPYATPPGDTLRENPNQ